MNYPIVQVETEDGLWLHGLFLHSNNSEKILINIHGTASNFYEEDFIESFASDLIPFGISLLSTNNRGVGVYDAWDKKGAAVEIFEECLKDIDAWVEFVIQNGYKKIILSGHSLGTEKVVYYLNKGKFRDKISGVILLAPADSPRWRYYDNNLKVVGSGETGKDRVDLQIQKAKEMIEQGRGDELMDRLVYSGVMPKSPKSLLNFLGENTEILKTLPFHSGKLEMYSKINVPILVVIGDQHEYTGIPIKEALELMKKENPLTEAHQMANCNHDFEDKEEELSKLVTNFVCKI
jgi:alpha-beta hydrolase superfamily lysophospholipase